MTAYAYIEDGRVTRTAESKDALPRSWRLADGRSVSGFHLLDDDRILTAGWLPVIDDKPTPGDGEMLVGPEVTIGDTEVTRTWTVQPIPPEPEPTPEEAESRAALTEMEKVRVKARSVYAGTDTFTAAQVQKLLAAMVLRLTR